MIPAQWEVCDWAALQFMAWGAPLTKAATHVEQIERCVDIADRVVTFASEHNAISAFVEGYAFAANSSSAYQLGELGGAVRYALAHHLDLYPKPISVSSVRSYLLGKIPPGKGAGKTAVEACLRRAGLELASNDEYDAFAVANYGIMALGFAGVCGALL